MKTEFTGDIVKKGILYPEIMQVPWAPSPEVHDFKPTDNLKNFKTFSDSFSTQMEISTNLRDSKNPSPAYDSIFYIYYLYDKSSEMKRANNTKQRDSMMKSPNAVSSSFLMKIP